MKRTLRVNKEVVGDLTPDQLRAVAGASHAGCATHGQSCDSCLTVPLNECFAIATVEGCIHVQESLLCPTTPMGGHA